MNIIFCWKGVKNVVVEELFVLLGMEEVFVFLWLEKYYNEGIYDVIVIDSVFIGEIFILFFFLQVVKFWMIKVFLRKNLVVKIVMKGVKFFIGVFLDKGLEEMDEFFQKLESIQKVFLDLEVVFICIVINLECMVIKEVC